MSVWEQTAALMATTNGAFDHVPVEKIKDAEKALLTRLHSAHRKDMDELNKGDKPSDKTKDLILKAAEAVAKSYVAEKKEVVKEVSNG
jgi:F-type H+-transporting ATPase subunit alpha